MQLLGADKKKSWRVVRAPAEQKKKIGDLQHCSLQHCDHLTGCDRLQIKQVNNRCAILGLEIAHLYIPSFDFEGNWTQLAAVCSQLHNRSRHGRLIFFR